MLFAFSFSVPRYSGTSPHHISCSHFSNQFSTQHHPPLSIFSTSTPNSQTPYITQSHLTFTLNSQNALPTQWLLQESWSSSRLLSCGDDENENDRKNSTRFTNQKSLLFKWPGKITDMRMSCLRSTTLILNQRSRNLSVNRYRCGL